MAERFLAELLTPDVLAEQESTHGRRYAVEPGVPADELGAEEAGFIESRDSFYLGTISSQGWPYVQHRGGPPGFLKVLSARQLAFADLKGNRQLISTGNLRGNDRVALFLMDYPGQRRLKLLGHGRPVDARDDPALADRVSPSAQLRKRVERVLVIDVVGFDWNCPAYITPRYSEHEVNELVEPLHRKIEALERALAALGTG